MTKKTSNDEKFEPDTELEESPYCEIYAVI
jgi:hypothetical protein